MIYPWPLLFILYINYISNLFSNSIDINVILYADDRSITNNSKINNNLKILSDWFINNNYN